MSAFQWFFAGVAFGAWLEATDAQVMEAQLVENLQRVDLSPMAIEFLQREFVSHFATCPHAATHRKKGKKS